MIQPPILRSIQMVVLFVGALKKLNLLFLDAGMLV